MEIFRASDFWRWVLVFKQEGTSCDAEAIGLHLAARPKAERIAIAVQYGEIKDSLNISNVYQVGSIVVGSYLGDDWFEYFRNWLIFQGPDFLADFLSELDDFDSVCQLHDVDGDWPIYEDLSSCATGSGLELPAKAPDFSNEAMFEKLPAEDLERLYPKLWQRYGAEFSG